MKLAFFEVFLHSLPEKNKELINQHRSLRFIHVIRQT